MKFKSYKNQFKYHFLLDKPKEKKWIRKSLSSSKNYLFDIYKYLRKNWQKRKKKFYSQISIFSYVPSILTLFKLLRCKKQQVRNSVKYRFLKKIFIGLKHNNLIEITKDSYLQSKQSLPLYLKRDIKLSFRDYKNKHEREKTIKKDIFDNNSLQYRLPYRHEKKMSSLLLIKYKLKYTLQEFLKKYLNVYIKIKIINSLAEFKTLKFYRFFFTTPKWRTFPELELKEKRPIGLIENSNKIRKTITYDESPNSNVFPYIYLGAQNFRFLDLNHLKSRHLKKKTIPNLILIPFRKNLDKVSHITNNVLSKKELLRSFSWKNQELLKKKKKNNLYKNVMKRIHTSFKLSKNKSWQYNQIGHDKKMAKFLKRTFPILSIFSKYLDAQILVDHIARELEYTKQHWTILSMLDKIMTLMPLERLIAYRIGIFGRVNSSKKARVMFLKKGKLPLQNFAQKINFGISQSRARIGSFGVKMWIYF